MIRDKLSLDVRIHAPIHTTDALHEPHRVPVNVVIDEPCGVLQVQTFRKNVRRDQHAYLGVPCLRDLL